MSCITKETRLIGSRSMKPAQQALLRNSRHWPMGQKFALKLVPEKGPGRFLVIDHVARL